MSGYNHRRQQNTHCKNKNKNPCLICSLNSIVKVREREDRNLEVRVRHLKFNFNCTLNISLIVCQTSKIRIKLTIGFCNVGRLDNSLKVKKQ